MPPTLAVACAFGCYFVAYRLYARFLQRRIFQLDPASVTPAHALRDDVDYCPTRKSVLFGHHFASITGLAPMLGPAVAVIWGWLPAMVWVVFGAILVGCVHDLGALVVSIRHRGMSIGQVTEQIVGNRARTLFHLIIFFGVALAMGVFVYVIARLFSLQLSPGRSGYPQSALPSGLLMLIAMGAGYLTYKRRWPLLPVAVAGFALELASIAIGLKFPTAGLPASLWPSPETWTWSLLAYAFLASVFPVWLLLQTRDFLNSLLLYLGLGLAFLGFFFGSDAFVAPALRFAPAGAPPMLPFVFVIVACGAASGIHGLVSSGTTAKQLNREPDAVPVGYGAMIGESLLALLAVVACTAGLKDTQAWRAVYSDWHAVQALPINIDVFIQGTTHFLSHLGLPPALSQALIAMVVVSFALTTLDSATRLLRFNIEEIGASLHPRLQPNRYASSALAVVIIGFFAFYQVETTVGAHVVMRPAGLALWQLFGTTNQMIAGLTLVVVTLYLRGRMVPSWPTAIPAIFMLVTSLAAMLRNLLHFTDPLIIGVGFLLLFMGLWLTVEAALCLHKKPPQSADLAP